MRSFILGVLILFGISTASPALIIDQDWGGRIGTYVDLYAKVAQTREEVQINGQCLSACTIALALPASQICVTRSAELGFHAAYDLSVNVMVTNKEATDLLMSYYPQPIQKWIRARGGLTRKMLYLRGKELRALFRPCIKMSSFAHTIY